MKTKVQIDQVKGEKIVEQSVWNNIQNKHRNLEPTFQYLNLKYDTRGSL